MSNKKHIDRVFQEAFKEFEETPPAANWNAISNRLHPKKKRRVLAIPLWYRLGGVAAVVALMAWGGYVVLQENTPANQLVDEEKSASFPSNKNDVFSVSPKEIDLNEAGVDPLPSTVSTKAVENDEPSKYNYVPGSRKNTIRTSNAKLAQSPQKEASRFTSSVKKSTSKQPVASLKATQKNSNEPAFSVPSEEHPQQAKKSTGIAQADPTTQGDEIFDSASEGKISLIEEAKKLAEAKEVIAQTKLPNKRWEINPIAAPVFYGGVGDGNAIDTRFNDNRADSDITLAYGVNVGYALTDKLQVRTGVNQVSLSYNTKDISFNPTVDAISLDNVTSITTARDIEVHDGIPSAPSGLVPSEVQNRLVEPIPGSINQTLGYVEVPVELSYRLVNRKLGLNIIGGGSTLFLNDNSIGIDSEFGRTTIGKANNLNEVSFSTNIGLGLDYELLKNFNLNLEPIFKYQINAYSDNPGNFKPYFFGVYSGFSFNF